MLFWDERCFILAHNVLKLQEVGDFEYENCLSPMNLIRSTKLGLTTEPPISGSCCYRLPFFSLVKFFFGNVACIERIISSVSFDCM